MRYLYLRLYTAVCTVYVGGGGWGGGGGVHIGLGQNNTSPTLLTMTLLASDSAAVRLNFI